MILDRLDHLDLYAGIHPLLLQAATFLRRSDLHQLPDGRHEILEDRLFAIVATSQGRGRDDSPLEAHRDYIDIQYIISGDEEIGYSPVVACTALRDPYDPTRDIMFFSDRPQTWLALGPGMLAILYPHDAHAPLAGSGPVRKVVVKVALNG